MSKILFITPENKNIEVEANESILSASLRAGITHAHACGGKGQCSTCRVVIESGIENCPNRNALEETMAQQLHFSPNIRLACQTKPTGSVKIRRLILNEEDFKVTDSLFSSMETGFASIGEVKEVAILFADIRGFTPITEKLLPFDVVYVLNHYFRSVNRAITAYDGQIVNYMGDGLLALFGIRGKPNPALRAATAALAMLIEVEELKKKFIELYQIEFDIGIGIHYGKSIIGSLSTKPGDLHIIGDAINLASRIETATKEYKVKILISDTIFHLIKDEVKIGRKFEGVEIKGKTGTYNLLELIGLNFK